MNRPVIIGGGVIGLAIGWQLTRLGVQPIVFERGEAGCGASNAAAGMIAPASEVHFAHGGLLDLFLESHRLYPDFVKDVEAASGLSVDFNRGGSLMIAVDQDDEADLLRLHDFQRELKLAVRPLKPHQAVQLEPLLSPNFSLALEAPDEYCLDNRRLVQGLKQAFIRGGGTLAEHRPVTAIRIQNNRICGVEAAGEFHAAEQVLLASGIDARLEGLPEALLLPIRPVKGQALDLKRDPARTPMGLGRVIRTIHRYPVYLVPRADGRITLGASHEEMGSDARVTAGAQLDLLYGAWKVLPAIEEMEIARTWVGFRPASRDHEPILGPTSIDGLHVAMGMYRHGILLAPLVGRLMADWVASAKKSAHFERFTWERFQKIRTNPGN